MVANEVANGLSCKYPSILLAKSISQFFIIPNRSQFDRSRRLLPVEGLLSSESLLLSEVSL